MLEGLVFRTEHFGAGMVPGRTPCFCYMSKRFTSHMLSIKSFGVQQHQCKADV